LFVACLLPVTGADFSAPVFAPKPTMKSSLSLAACLLLAGTAGSVADTVELNGLTSLFGENVAFMLLHRPGPAQPVSFVLFEGQAQFGIKLLAVDIHNQRAQIEQLGETQYVRLSSAPDLALIGAPVQPGPFVAVKKLSPQDQQQLDNFLNADPDVQKLRSGAPVRVPIYSGNVPGNTSGNSASGNSSSSPDNPVANNANPNQNSSSGGSTLDGSTSGSSADSPAISGGSNGSSSPAPGSSVDETQQYWYVTSRNIELTRLATAAQVADGEANPLPRTPLTPANTPPDLVGQETFFGNHIPGFVNGGSPYAVDENGDPIQ
jgi:hypothetical protein